MSHCSSSDQTKVVEEAENFPETDSLTYPNELFMSLRPKKEDLIDLSEAVIDLLITKNVHISITPASTAAGIISKANKYPAYKQTNKSHLKPSNTRYQSHPDDTSLPSDVEEGAPEWLLGNMENKRAEADIFSFDIEGMLKNMELKGKDSETTKSDRTTSPSETQFHDKLSQPAFNFTNKHRAANGHHKYNNNSDKSMQFNFTNRNRSNGQSRYSKNGDVGSHPEFRNKNRQTGRSQQVPGPARPSNGLKETAGVENLMNQGPSQQPTAGISPAVMKIFNPKSFRGSVPSSNGGPLSTADIFNQFQQDLFAGSGNGRERAPVSSSSSTNKKSIRAEHLLMADHQQHASRKPNIHDEWLMR